MQSPENLLIFVIDKVIPGFKLLSSIKLNVDVRRKEKLIAPDYYSRVGSKETWVTKSGPTLSK